MKLADRYILSELTGPLFLSGFGFLLFMVANILFLLVEQITLKQIPLFAVLEMLLLRIPAMLVLTFPVAMLFATLLGLGRLAADHEIMAMRTSGIRFIRLALPILCLALGLTVFTFFTNEKISPWATHQSENIVRRILLRQTLPPVEANVFIHGPNGTTFYIGSLDKTEKMLHHVMIFEPSDAPYPRMTVADRARYDGQRFYLYKGSVHQYASNGLTRYETSFDQMVVPVMFDPDLFVAQKTPFEMNAGELKQQIELLKRSGLSTQSLSTEYHFKWSLPFGCLVAGFIGIPLGVRFPNGGRFITVALSVLLLFAYYCLFAVSRSLGTLGMLPPVVAAWLPNVILGVIGLKLLFSEEHVRS